MGEKWCRRVIFLSLSRPGTSLGTHSAQYRVHVASSSEKQWPPQQVSLSQSSAAIPAQPESRSSRQVERQGPDCAAGLWASQLGK